MRRIVVFIAGLLIFLNCYSNIMAACSLDRHANCVGTCSGGSCSDEHGGCECIANNPPVSPPDDDPDPVLPTQNITNAPTDIPLATAIPCPNGVCPTNSPTGWNKPCGNDSYCGPGYYCCGVNNANCCEIGEVDPTNDPNPAASSTPGPTPTATPTITLTPSPTPTAAPGPWIKLKDTSFVSKNSLYNHIPLAPVAFDADDDGSPYFIINSLSSSSGLVSAPSLNITGLNANAKPNATSQQLTYTTTYPLSPSSFISYVKSRKTYYTITSLDQIDKDGIYMIDSGLIIDTTPSSFNNYNVVLLSNSTVVISASSFNPDKSIAIIAPTINFGSDVSLAKGLFITNSFNTGTNVLGLKINGNLIVQETLTNGRTQSNLNQPSLFVVFDSKPYIDLLPYLSTASYEWKQVQ